VTWHSSIIVLFVVLVAGVVGVVTADWILYGIGRCYGTDVVDHPRIARLLGANRIDAVRSAVMRHQDDLSEVR
jgi:membrane protein DedA with SNARE-associated domain